MRARSRRARRFVQLGLLLGIVAALAPALGGSAVAAPGDVTASRLADIRPGPADSNHGSLFNANGTLLFGADDGAHGMELWKSNGGPLGSGTGMVADIATGDNSNPTEFTDVNGTVFFVAGDPTNGSELRKIASPFTTPTLVENIRAGSQSGVLHPAALTNVDGTLFFAADDGTHGEELWKSVPPYDASSTDLVKDINTTSAGASSSPNLAVAVGDTLIFEANKGSDDDLWKSTPPYDSSSTTEIDVNPSGDSFPGPFAVIGGTVFLSADDGSGDGFELFKLPSPYTTPVQVKDINPTGDADPNPLVNVGGTLFFIATDGDQAVGTEVWKSVAPYDSASTTPLDVNPGTPSSDPFDLTKVGGMVFFRADDGVHGAEPWTSDGGPVGAGTHLVADINPSGSSFPSQFTDVGGTAHFEGFGAGGEVLLMRSNGTGATPASFPGGPTLSMTGLTNVNGTLFFQGNDSATGPELWKATIEPPAPIVTPTPAASAPAPVKKKKCKKKKHKRGAVAKKKTCKKKKRRK